jgi:hypothetical protein
LKPQCARLCGRELRHDARDRPAGGLQLLQVLAQPGFVAGGDPYRAVGGWRRFAGQVQILGIVEQAILQ